MLRFLFLALFLLFVLAPLYWVVVTSIKPTSDYLAIPPVWFPDEPTIVHYTAALFAYRGFAGLISDLDRSEAFAIGRHAVEAADKGSASVALQFAGGATALRTVPLEAVAGRTRLMPPEFIAASGSDVTEACKAYLNRLLPPRPDAWTPFV